MTRIDSYPWAVPTEEQKAIFDALSYAEQLKMLRQAIIDGENSGVSDSHDMEKLSRKPSKKQGYSLMREIL